MLRFIFLCRYFLINRNISLVIFTRISKILYCKKKRQIKYTNEKKNKQIKTDYFELLVKRKQYNMGNL